MGCMVKHTCSLQSRNKQIKSPLSHAYAMHATLQMPIWYSGTWHTSSDQCEFLASCHSIYRYRRKKHVKKSECVIDTMIFVGFLLWVAGNREGLLWVMAVGGMFDTGCKWRTFHVPCWLRGCMAYGSDYWYSSTIGMAHNSIENWPISRLYIPESRTVLSSVYRWSILVSPWVIRPT